MVLKTKNEFPEKLILAIVLRIISVPYAYAKIGGHFLHASLSQLELLWHDDIGFVRVLENVKEEYPSELPILEE